MSNIDLSAEWIASGDRSHPNLKLIDEELKYSLTYDGYEDDLEELEIAHLEGDTYTFDITLHKIKEREKIHNGDRSHPRLVQLDSLRWEFYYDGWERDCDEAEKAHLHSITGSDFDRIMESMRRKQAIHDGDRTHDDLQFLDSLSLSYHGSEQDIEKLLDDHINGWDLLQGDKFGLTEKQRMHEGDRSHPRLVALDSLWLTYPGWEDDVGAVEKEHAGGDFGCSTEVTEDYEMLLENLSRKQHMHETGVEDLSSMNPIQREIIETEWSYPGWEEDIEEVRDNRYVCLFDNYLEKCNLRQMVFGNNFYSHPALIKLHSMQLSYPGWEEDVEGAQEYLYNNGYTEGSFGKERVDEKIEAMENKQILYDGASRSEKNTLEKRTPVTLYHSTDVASASKIRSSNAIRANRDDKNNACRRVGLAKIWTCATAAGRNNICCKHGTERFSITANDLRNESESWIAYRTRDYDGYCYEGCKRVFYNFFLVPEDKSLPKKCLKKLVRADMNDSDPVQLFWNDGDMYILEMNENGNGSDSTSDRSFSDASDVNPGNKKRSFHVAVVCWRLRLSSATEETDISEEDTDSDDTAEDSSEHDAYRDFSPKDDSSDSS